MARMSRFDVTACAKARWLVTFFFCNLRFFQIPTLFGLVFWQFNFFDACPLEPVFLVPASGRVVVRTGELTLLQGKSSRLGKSAVLKSGWNKWGQSFWVHRSILFHRMSIKCRPSQISWKAVCWKVSQFPRAKIVPKFSLSIKSLLQVNKWDSLQWETNSDFLFGLNDQHFFREVCKVLGWLWPQGSGGRKRFASL